jgi:phosphate starvation-inducible PhoH-like protein
VDLPKNQKSGLVEALSLLKGVEGIGVLELEAKDVVRHRLVKKIIEAYDKQPKNQQ